MKITGLKKYHNEIWAGYDLHPIIEALTPGLMEAGFEFEGFNVFSSKDSAALWRKKLFSGNSFLISVCSTNRKRIDDKKLIELTVCFYIESTDQWVVDRKLGIVPGGSPKNSLIASVHATWLARYWRPIDRDFYLKMDGISPDYSHESFDALWRMLSDKGARLYDHFGSAEKLAYGILNPKSFPGEADFSPVSSGHPYLYAFVIYHNAGLYELAAKVLDQYQERLSVLRNSGVVLEDYFQRQRGWIEQCLVWLVDKRITKTQKR